MMTRLLPHQWQILRDLRLASLADSEQWFASTVEAESQLTDEQWQERATEVWGLLILDAPCGLVRISPVDDDRGSDCWITAWWIDPRCRGQGHAHRMQDWLDDTSRERQWRVQGLGVWPENTRAIAAYQRLGYIPLGEPKPSTRRPGQFYQEMLRRVPTTSGEHHGR